MPRFHHRYGKQTGTRRSSAASTVSAFFLLILLSFAGCISTPTGGPPPPEKFYTLEYPSPRFPHLAPLGLSIEVGKIHTADAFRTTAMIYRTGPFERQIYHYDRWVAPPGDLVASFILRDMESSGLFEAVFSIHSMQMGDGFHLSGEVQEFLEIDEENRCRASVVLLITLTDRSTQRIDERIILQKTYRYTGLSGEQTALGFAMSMSGAIERLSAELIEDVHAALR
jgi:ABC-type uncharacterized transport system auxiliary subunit